MTERRALKKLVINTRPEITLTPVVEIYEDDTCRIHHIKSDSIATDGRDTFVPIRHASKQKRRIFDLEDENAKLRELVADMFECIRHANEQDWFYFERDKSGCGMSCTVNGESCGLALLVKRVRELGIEVKK